MASLVSILGSNRRKPMTYGCRKTKNHLNSWAWIFSALFCLSLLIGCGDGRPRRVPVSGHVTVDGQLLEHGSILFAPADNSRSGGGSLEAGGLYRVSIYTAYDGLMPGKYNVSVLAVEPMGETAQRWHAPMKYRDAKTSGLSVEITEETTDLDFELTWEGDKHSGPFVEKMK